MDLNIKNESVKIVNGNYNSRNFIIVDGDDNNESLMIELHPYNQYIEVREKEDIIKIFLFKNKIDTYEYDFGYFKDASIIYSNNSVIPYE